MTAAAPLAELRAQLGPALPSREAYGCPCGCESRPPYLDDPDCARHRRGPDDAPSTYGLSAAELSAEITARRLDGWHGWELRERFVDPRQVAV